MLLVDSHKRGIMLELECAKKFTELGFLVSIPVGSFRYDMLVDNGSKIFRIQCKCASLQENGSYVVGTSTSVCNTKLKNIKYYSREEIDFIVTIISDTLVVIPVEDVRYSKAKVFRVELPRFGAKSNVNLISDYTVEKFMI